MNDNDLKWLQREVLLGLWKVHILHHASEQAIYGQWMLQELRHHGYDVSPGTLYPILARLEHHDLLKGDGAPYTGSKARRELLLTDKGRKMLEFLRQQVRELHDEIAESEKTRSKRRRRTKQ